MTYGLFKAETAKLALETVKYLVQNGFVLDVAKDNEQILRKTPIYIKNESSETMPAYACAQITGAVEDGGQNYITANKPVDETGAAGGYIFNSHAPIEPGGYGIGEAGPVVRMLFYGSPATSGQVLGPTVDSWSVKVSACGPFKAIGSDDIAEDVIRAFTSYSCCCNDGECGFSCTGTFCIGGVTATPTTSGGSGCTCTGPTFYAVTPNASSFTSPPFPTGFFRCCLLWDEINGQCDEEVVNSNVVVDDRGGTLPPAQYAPCGIGDFDQLGIAYGTYFCCWKKIGVRRRSDVFYSICFNDDNTITYAATEWARIKVREVTNSHGIRYSRDIRWTRGAVHPTNPYLCLYTPSWLGDPYVDPGSSCIATDCPPEEPTIDYDAIDWTTGESPKATRGWSATVSITNCSEIFNAVELTETSETDPITVVEWCACDFISNALCNSLALPASCGASGTLNLSAWSNCQLTALTLQIASGVDCGGGPTLSDFFFTNDSDGGINGIDNLIWDLGK